MKGSKVKVTGGVMFTYGRPIECPLLQSQLHGGRGLEFSSVTQPEQLELEGRPHIMSAPTNLLVNFAKIVMHRCITASKANCAI